MSYDGIERRSGKSISLEEIVEARNLNRDNLYENNFRSSKSDIRYQIERFFDLSEGIGRDERRKKEEEDIFHPAIADILDSYDLWLFSKNGSFDDLKNKFIKIFLECDNKTSLAASLFYHSRKKDISLILTQFEYELIGRYSVITIGDTYLFTNKGFLFGVLKSYEIDKKGEIKSGITETGEIWNHEDPPFIVAGKGFWYK